MPLKKPIPPKKTPLKKTSKSSSNGLTVSNADKGHEEEALRESEENFRVLFDENPLPTVLSEMPSGIIAFANKRMAEMLGMSPEDIIGKTANDLGLLKNPADLEKLTKLIIGQGHVDNFEVEKVFPGGARGTDLISMRLVSINKKHYCLTVIQDVTERKQAAEALSRSEKRYRLLYEYAPIGILLVSRSGQILEVNPAAIQILGSPSAEATKGINILTFPLLIQAGISAAFRQCVEMGQVVFDEYPYVTKWGKSICQELRFVPIFDDHDRVNLVHAIIEDVTERKRMEEELQKAQKLESLGVLAGGIAHDFNNLLTGIYGYIDLARSVSKDARAVEYLEATLSSMTRARALTLQLLTFAKGGAPVQKLTLLAPFIREAAQFALSGSNISCRFDLAENLWPCNIDKNQIGQVIDNIVINAQQAMPNGGSVEISAKNITLGKQEHPLLRPLNPPSSEVPKGLLTNGVPPAGEPEGRRRDIGDYVKISVKDSGIGIPKDVMPRIFDPFYTTKTKGHGLGLATCYSIINRHGGRIDVESAPGMGSAFHVYLPATTNAVAADDAAIVKHTGSGAIIVMDDEEMIRTTVGDMLESLGYSVACKNDGKEAVDFYCAETGAGRRIDAMIFDLTVPGGMGGIEAVAELRKLNKDIPVFVASGYAEKSVMKDPVRFGFTASICKPFTMAELSEMLNRYLKG